MRDPLIFARLVSVITHLRGNELENYQISDIATLCEQMSGQAKREDIDTLLASMQNGRKIEAIKIYRQLTGVGLKESKDTIERYGYAPPPVNPPEPQWEPSLRSLGIDHDSPF